MTLRRHPVLTDNKIASTALPQTQTKAALSALQSAAFKCVGPDLHFTRFRGNGWQVLIAHAQSPLRIAVKSALRSDTVPEVAKLCEYIAIGPLAPSAGPC